MSLRSWLKKELGRFFPLDGRYDDDRYPVAFCHWIGRTAEKYREYCRQHPGHTCCVDFLTIVNAYICQKGYSGAGFGPLLLPNLRGWHGLSELGGENGCYPNDCDFFYGALPQGGGHVGVLWEAASWTTIAGGADHDGKGAISRHSGFPNYFDGWLDIDTFYGTDNPYIDDPDP